MAIQISGTSVINNSRQLQNITSVDATTAAAIGTAGVGGSLSLINTHNFTSNWSTYQYTFPTGYNSFIIEVANLQGPTTNVLVMPRVRLTNSSGSVFTSGYSNGNFTTTATAGGMADFIDFGQVYGFIGKGARFWVHVHSPREAGSRTWGHGVGISGNNGFVYTYKGSYLTETDNRDFYVYQANGSGGFGAMGSLNLWGIK